MRNEKNEITTPTSSRGSVRRPALKVRLGLLGVALLLAGGLGAAALGKRRAAQAWVVAFALIAVAVIASLGHGAYLGLRLLGVTCTSALILWLAAISPSAVVRMTSRSAGSRLATTISILG